MKIDATFDAVMLRSCVDAVVELKARHDPRFFHAQQAAVHWSLAMSELKEQVGREYWLDDRDQKLMKQAVRHWRKHLQEHPGAETPSGVELLLAIAASSNRRSARGTKTEQQQPGQAELLAALFSGAPGTLAGVGLDATIAELSHLGLAENADDGPGLFSRTHEVEVTDPRWRENLEDETGKTRIAITASVASERIEYVEVEVRSPSDALVQAVRRIATSRWTAHFGKPKSGTFRSASAQLVVRHRKSRPSPDAGIKGWSILSVTLEPVDGE